MAADAAPQTTIAGGPLEAVIDGMAVAAGMYLYGAVDVAGKLDPHRLRDALDCVADEEPRLRARYVRRAWRSRWVVDDRPSLTLVEERANDEDEAHQLEQSFCALREDPAGRAPVEMLLIHLPRGDRLVVRSAHLLTDGHAAKTLLYRIAETYSRLFRDAGWRPAGADPAPSTPWHAFGALRFSNLADVLRGLIADQVSLVPWPAFFVPMSVAADESISLAMIRIEPDRMTRLKARWRDEGITVNDLVCAALTRALATCFRDAVGQHRSVKMIMTSDLRQYLPADRYLGNVSVLRVLTFGSLPLPGPAEHVQRVRGITASWKRTWLGLGMSLQSLVELSILPDAVTRAAARWLFRPRTGRKMCMIALTNIGVIDTALLRFGDTPCTDARIVPPVARSPMLIFGVTGCEGSVTLTFGYRPAALPRETAERILREFEREIEALLVVGG